MPLLTTICSYAFSGINVCAAGITIKASYPHYDAFYIFGIGVAFFLMVPITLADKRKENRDARYALYAGIMHSAEIFIYFLIGHLIKSHYRKKSH